MECLTKLVNMILDSEKMKEECKKSVQEPIFKNKGDVHTCSNYRGMKQNSHTMMIWEE